MGQDNKYENTAIVLLWILGKDFIVAKNVKFNENDIMKTAEEKLNSASKEEWAAGCMYLQKIMKNIGKSNRLWNVLHFIVNLETDSDN